MEGKPSFLKELKEGMAKTPKLAKMEGIRRLILKGTLGTFQGFKMGNPPIKEWDLLTNLGKEGLITKGRKLPQEEGWKP